MNMGVRIVRFLQPVENGLNFSYCEESIYHVPAKNESAKCADLHNEETLLDRVLKN